VGALIAYVVWQQRGDAEPEYEAEARIETDEAPDLPGEWVDLPSIYGGTYPETAGFTGREVDYSAQGFPPAGGPFWGNAPCPEDQDEAPRFCGPAKSGAYLEPWEPEVLVHNMRRGGVVLWYNTTDEELVEELRMLLDERGGRVVMTPYDDIDEEHVALTAWARRDVFPVAEYTEDRILGFIDAFEERFDP
jgi:hypothetical protein